MNILAFPRELDRLREMNACLESSSPMTMKRTPPTWVRRFLTVAEELLGNRMQGMDMRTSSNAGTPRRHAAIIRARDTWTYAARHQEASGYTSGAAGTQRTGNTGRYVSDHQHLLKHVTAALTCFQFSYLFILLFRSPAVGECLALKVHLFINLCKTNKQQKVKSRLILHIFSKFSTS